MPRTRELDDFNGTAVAGIDGPLFAAAAIASGPFAHSAEKPTPEEVLVGEMLWAHQGRAMAVSAGEVAAVTGIEYRFVKATVQRLRNTHKCRIGSKHAEPPGYYWIVDEEDRRLAVAPLRSQIEAMWDTLLVINSPESNGDLLKRMREKY